VQKISTKFRWDHPNANEGAKSGGVGNKKLSYHKGTARRAILVRPCYIS